MSLANRKWKARPGNVSTEGMFVRLEPDAPVSIERHTPVVIEIAFGDEAPLKLHGTIRSHRAGGYGIFFPKRTDTGYVNPLEGLGHIWAELQRDDLSKRLFLGKDWLASYEGEK
jgi:hypothetical protein